MATFTAEAISETGLNATYNVAAAGGDKVLAGANTFLHVKNGSGGAITVTITTPVTVKGLAVTDPVTSIPAGEDRFIGPLDPDLYADVSDSSLVSFAYSSETSVTVAAIYL
jgi:hypothetical protein